jgi:uncharacterized membrane protein
MSDPPGRRRGHPRLADVIERNILTIAALRERALRAGGLQGRSADAVTRVSGRMAFVYLHVAWFGAWILANTGRFGVAPFDPYPYGLLTMVVSLEAIFLSTFVLISQNRDRVEAERRADLALQIGLLTEHEVTRLLRMLDAVQDKLGAASGQDGDLKDLETETRPEDVLAEIAKVQRRLDARG